MRIVAIIFLGVTLLIPAFCLLREAIRLSRSRFLKASGKIEYSGIAGGEPMVENTKVVPVFVPDIRYTFIVGGSEYEGHNLSYAKKGSSRRKDIERMMSAYQVGDIVDVHYDSNAPSDCYLSDPKKYWGFHVALAAACVGVFALLASAIWKLG